MTDWPPETPISITCTCGWAWQGPEGAREWLEFCHARAHNKGHDGLTACGHMTIYRCPCDHEECEPYRHCRRFAHPHHPWTQADEDRAQRLDLKALDRISAYVNRT
jgi:hypothetical protein